MTSKNKTKGKANPVVERTDIEGPQKIAWTAPVLAPNDDARPHRRRTAVLVVGAHRSGTSMLTGILARLGCEAARSQMPANFANEKGYHESLAIAQFNDKLLKSAGVVWDDLEKVPEGWFSSPHAEHARDTAAELLDQEFGAAPFFVLKDPRISRLMPFWRAVFRESGIDPVAVHIHRSPLEVAASLAARDGTPEAYGHALWLRNHLEGERGTRGLPRAFTSYDAVIANWASETARIAATLRLTWPRLTSTAAVEISDFVTSGLRHFRTVPEQVTDNPVLPDWLRESFSVAEAWARDGEDASGRDILDRVLTGFDAGVAVFVPLVVTSQTERAAREAAETRATEAEAARDAARAESDAAEMSRREIEIARDAEAEAYAAAVEEHKATLRRLESERDQRRAELEDAHARANAAEKHLSSARADAARTLRESRAAEAETAARLERRETEFAEERAALKAREGRLVEAFRAETNRLEVDRDARLARLRDAAEDHRAALERERTEAGLHAAERDELKAERDALSHDRTALMTSTSWRVTAPLRWLRETLRLG